VLFRSVDVGKPLNWICSQAFPAAACSPNDRRPPIQYNERTRAACAHGERLLWRGAASLVAESKPQTEKTNHMHFKAVWWPLGSVMQCRDTAL
jgi:hypothetical protein